MLYSILVRFKKSRKLAQLVRSSRYTLLVGPDSLAVWLSGFASAFRLPQEVVTVEAVD